MLSTIKLDRSSVFLVSGGAKGITKECVIKLAQYYQCRWILLGRSELLEVEPIFAQDCFTESELKKRIMQDFLAKGEKPTPITVEKIYQKIASSREIKQTLSHLSELGSLAEYISVDITDAIALKNRVALAAAELGTITGIIHGAGVLADKRIENKTEQDFETVYAAKVKGLENLLVCVNPEQLDYLILFSSVAGFFGNIGQTDYALANEILNKSAHLFKQHYPSCHVVAINWGPWDSGMVTPLLKKAFSDRNIELISLDVGAEMLVREIATTKSKDPQIIIGSPIVLTAENSSNSLRSYRIRRQLTLEANPCLQDYKIGDFPILPLSCVAAWIGHSCEQFYPGYRTFSLENFKVVKEIVFDGTQGSEFILDIKEVDKNNLDEIIFEVILWSEHQDNYMVIHYSSQVKIKSKIPTQSIYDFSKNNSSQFINPNKSQGFSILNITTQKLTLQCLAPEITEGQQGQFMVKTLNPYIADALFQSISVWVKHIYQMSCTPSDFQLFEQFKPIRDGEEYYISVDIKSQIQTQVIADVTAHNLDGQVYSRLLGISAGINNQI